MAKIVKNLEQAQKRNSYLKAKVRAAMRLLEILGCECYPVMEETLVRGKVRSELIPDMRKRSPALSNGN